MGYNDNFYIEYKKYLREPDVRAAHGKMFRLFDLILLNGISKTKIVDLGCGVCEFTHHEFRNKNNYFGIDKNNFDNREDVIIGDYLNLNLLDETPFKPDVFISLFSTENMMPAQEKYKFYEELFKKVPTLEFGMVAGFFYKSHKTDYVVQETGEIVSYQSIEAQKDYDSSIFWEIRTHIDVPSKMWGPDVVEVWKFFINKKGRV
jgi:hypothetical protein